MMFNDCFCLTEAVIEKRKLQTRRIEKGLELLSESNHKFDGEKIVLDFEASYEPIIIRPRYKVGEIVAVAQRYSECGSANFDEWEKESDWFQKGFANKMFVKPDLMPHQVRITNVRLERLQDISDRDCLQEGVRETEIRKYKENPVGDIEVEVEICSCLKKNDGRSLVYPTPREAFAALIDKTSGKGTWNRNPYVFVYEFKLVR